MNTKLLRKVKEHILAEPRRLMMAWFIEKRLGLNHRIHIRGTRKTRPFPKCDTAACVAGWTCLLNDRNFPKQDGISWSNTARELLGITAEQGNRLFVPSLWPKKFLRGIADDGRPSTAKIAAARIEWFIRTKGRE